MPLGTQVEANKVKNQEINTNTQQNQQQDQNRRSIPQDPPREAAPQVQPQAMTPMERLEAEMTKLQEEIQICVQDAVQLYQGKKALVNKYVAKKKEAAATDEEKAQKAEKLGEFNENFKAKDEVYGRVVRRILRLQETLGEKQMEHRRLYIQEAGIQVTEDLQDENEEINIERQLVALAKFQENDWGKVKDVSTRIDELRRRREKLENRRKLRYRLEDTAKDMSKKAKDYRESGMSEAYKEMDGDELLELYIQQAETLWDGEQRKTFLSAGFITEHIVRCLSLMDIWKEFQKKRVGLRVPEDQVERLKKADRVLKYYRQHVNTVLGDYGMNLGQLSYSQSSINAIANGEKLYEQKNRWEDDFIAYQSLAEKDIDYTGINEPGIRAPERYLRILERRAGIALDTNMDIVQSVYDAKESTKFQERIERNGSTYVRLKVDTLLSNGDFQRRSDKEARLFAVSKAFIQKLKEEGEWRENSEFAKVPELILSYMESYRNNYDKHYSTFEKEEEKFRLELKDTLDRIVLTGQGFREKQYASMLRDYLSFNENGSIVIRQDIARDCNEYRKTDREFAGMGIEQVNMGNRFVEKFRSVKEEPLFPHDPVLRDLNQGMLGDCYLISAIASVVARNPQRIKEMMQDNGDGTVTVQFYENRYDTKTAIAVTVDKTIPERFYDGHEKKGDPYARGALWVKMIEKAYAVLRDKESKELIEPDRVSSYKNAEEGHFEKALAHLTGASVASDSNVNYSPGVRNFEGRLNDEHMQVIGGRKMNSPSLMYFHQRHKEDKDRKVFRYMAGKTRWMWGSDRRSWDAEISRYKTLEKAMDKMLNLNEGQMEISAMDNGALSKALESLIKELEGYIEKLKTYTGHSLKKERLDEAGVPKKFHKLLRECWKACGQDAVLLQRDIVGMANLYRSKLDDVQQVQEYTKKEEDFYRNIQNVLRRGGSCGFGTKIFDKRSEAIRGNAGEGYWEGMCEQHAYAILGTQEVTVGNRTRKFLQVFNPHAQSIPIYQIDEKGNLKRTGFDPKTDQEKNYEEATHGVFLLELRDARSLMVHVGYSGNY